MQWCSCHVLTTPSEGVKVNAVEGAREHDERPDKTPQPHSLSASPSILNRPRPSTSRRSRSFREDRWRRGRRPPPAEPVQHGKPSLPSLPTTTHLSPRPASDLRAAPSRDPPIGGDPALRLVHEVRRTRTLTSSMFDPLARCPPVFGISASLLVFPEAHVWCRQSCNPSLERRGTRAAS